MSAINLPGASLQGPGLPIPYSRALIAATGRRRQPTGAPTPGEDGI